MSEKESYRWVLGYKKATELAKNCPDTQVIMIADRESDLYIVNPLSRTIFLIFFRTEVVHKPIG